MLAEFAGTGALYFNDFTTARTTGNDGTSAQQSLTVGSKSAFGGIGNYWDGTIAEIIGYSGLLSATAKAQLRQYIRGRYAITVG
jgi:hypothetical protein